MHSFELTDTQILALKPSYQSQLAHAMHPNSSEVDANVNAYLAARWPWPSEEAKERFLRSDINKYISFTMPNAKDNLTEPGSLWFTLYFIIDDIMEEISDKGQAVAQIFPLTLGSSKPNEGNPSEEAIYDVHKRCREAGDEVEKEGFQRLSLQNIEWMKYVMKKRREAASVVPKFDTFEDFYQDRVEEVGAPILYPFARWACGLYISEEILKHPKIRALEATFERHATYVNDLYSLRKELKEVQKSKQTSVEIFCPNAVLFLVENEGLNFEQAMGKLLRELPALEKEFLECRRELVLTICELFGADMGNMVEKYAEILELFMSGNVEWSASCGRYNDFTLY